MSLQISLQKPGISDAAKMGLKKLLMTFTEAQINQQDSFNSFVSQSPLPVVSGSSEIQAKEVGEVDEDTTLRVFEENLRKVPEAWIRLLFEDRIQSESSKIIINTSITLTELYQILLKSCEEDIKKWHHTLNHQCRIQPTFQQRYINQTCLALIAQVFNNFAKDLVACFMEGRSIIARQVQVINEVIKTSEIMNSYMLFALLKQVASSTQRIITANIHQKFPLFTQQKCRQFCKYIQKNYEFIELACMESGNNYIYTKKQKVEYIKEQNLMWLTFIRNNNNVSLRKIKNMEGQAGILIVKKTQDKKKQKQGEKEKEKGKLKEKPKEQLENEDQKLILRIENGNQIKIINAKICQESWRIFESKDSFNEIYENLQKQIELWGKNGNKQYISYGVQTCQFATIGGSLGKCLADINQYQSANQFFMDLSKTAAIYSTISYAMASIPILSYFIIAGGFTYSFYVACSNEATSSFKKFDQIKNFTMSAMGSIGSTLGGIMLGQAIIPVPFVGAFIGGVLGGFLGTKGVRDINQFLAKSNFRQIIAYMKRKLIADRYWECTHHLLERIGLSQQYFNKHTPAQKQSRDVYMTAICFCIVTFYQSKRYIEFNKQKMNEHKDKTSEKQMEEQLFANEFNLVGIIEFLTEREFVLIEQLDLLGNFISHLV